MSVPRRSLGRTAALATALLACMLGAAPAARADIGETIILRCTHGQSLSGFSPSAYAKALKELSADAEEYTNCASLIRQAQLSAAGHGAPGAGAAAEAAAAALPASPAELKSLAKAQRSAPAPVSLGGSLVAPGVVHANIASALSSLPTPLLAVLALLAACLALVAGNALRNRFRGRRAD